MIEGCNYSRTLDFHRIIPGRDGGKYQVGNMYALCLNHHQEIERGIIEIEIVSKSLLRIKKE